MPILDGLIELFEISGGGLPNTIYFCNDINEDGTSILFDTNEYLAYPILASSGWERTLEGALPRPTISLSNVLGQISSLLASYSLKDAKLVRKIVPIKNLDNGIQPNPAGVIKTETYFVSRFEWNNSFATMNLRSPLDVENLRIPRRIVGSLLTLASCFLPFACLNY